MNKYEQPDFSIHNTWYLFFMFVTVLFQHFMSLSSGEKCYENFWYTRAVREVRRIWS